MNNRIFAAGLAGAIGLGATLAPVEALARGGGSMMGGAGFHPGLSHGAFHPFVSPSFVPPRPVAAPAALPDHGFRVGSNFDAFRFRSRRFFSRGLPLAGIGIYYGDYDDQIADSVAYQQPVYLPAGDGLVPAAGYQVAAERGVCRSQTVTVPAESGGQRRVTITRC
jgi:hypothetical protein